MPNIPQRYSLQIVRFGMASPFRVVADIPPETWGLGIAAASTLGSAIAFRLRLVSRIVAALETLAAAPGRIRNSALEEQVREAILRGDLHEAGLRRLTSEDELEEYRRGRARGFRIADAQLELPPTPEAAWPDDERLAGPPRPGELPADEKDERPPPPRLPRGDD